MSRRIFHLFSSVFSNKSFFINEILSPLIIALGDDLQICLPWDFSCGWVKLRTAWKFALEENENSRRTNRDATSDQKLFPHCHESVGGSERKRRANNFPPIITLFNSRNDRKLHTITDAHHKGSSTNARSLFSASTTQNDGFAFTTLVIDSFAKFKNIRQRHQSNKSASEKMKNSLRIGRDYSRRFRGLNFVARPFMVSGGEVVFKIESNIGRRLGSTSFEYDFEFCEPRG